MTRKAAPHCWNTTRTTGQVAVEAVLFYRWGQWWISPGTLAGAERSSAIRKGGAGGGFSLRFQEFVIS